MDDNKNKDSRASSAPGLAPISDTQIPTAVVNGQPGQPSLAQTGEKLSHPYSRWRTFFIVLGVLQAAGVAFFLIVMLWAIQQARSGASGTEFIALILYVTLVPLVAFIALVNLIGLPFYIAKEKPQGKARVMSMLSLILSLGLFLFGAYGAYQMYSVPKKMTEQSREKSIASDQKFAKDNSKPEITKAEAINLLKTCQLKGFYYTNQNEPEVQGSVTFPSAEASSTGIVLVNIDGKPYRIRIADRLNAELVPIARESQKTCSQLQFWHDGTYEQFKNGSWYFNTAIVNTMQSGKTKDEALKLMKDCKVDYFVGYTADINAAKDESTRLWLAKAEKSTTGIEISDTGSKTYVFASKSMTAELQDTARTYRASCYATKKLYLTIDDMIETEYPIGTWKKVKL